MHRPTSHAGAASATPAPSALHTQAARNLEFIRSAMERASEFTAVPGWGGVAMGSTALVAAALSGGARRSGWWLQLWLGEAVVASTLGAAAMVLKAMRSGTTLAALPARRFALAFLPAVVSGAVLTFALRGEPRLLPGCWLLLYGTAVASAGALSVRPVWLMGMLLMALGVAALLAAPAGGDAFMAAGFGGVQIVFGAIIARKHGG
jgi:hypothetical protein